MELYLMFTITDRSRLPRFIDLYQRHGLAVNLVTLGHGTAASETLNYLGLDRTEKAVCFAVVTDGVWSEIRGALRREMRIDVPGTGIAFTVPLSSIGGKRELAFLTAGQNFEKGEESTLKNTEHELLVAISEQGYSETVMDAARHAGAGGGTVIHAKGTGMQQAEKFLGISLASEKDLIFIVAVSGQKDAIMASIMREAGLETRAKAIVFSLPVTDTAGLRLIEDT